MVPTSDSVENKFNSRPPRKFYTQAEFDELYLKNDDENKATFGQKSIGFLRTFPRRVMNYYGGAAINESFVKSLLGFLYSFFPFIEVLRNYDVQNWLANDLVTGFTVGIMHVPQGDLAFIT